MTTTKAMEKIMNKGKGTFRNMIYESPCKLRAAYKNDVLVKRVEKQVRFGIEYANLKSVRERLADATGTVHTDRLPWGTWKKYPYVIEHKGTEYIRCYNVPTSKTKVTYYLNGVKTPLHVIEPMMLASSASSNDCFTIKVENIIAIQ